MLDLFNQYISENRIFQKDEKILLAVSGGIDSMIMTRLFSESDIMFGIAHCNFQLRGKESDRDEQFVKEYAAKYKLAFYHNKFDTTAYAKKNKISIQMAARNLRYKWFEEVRADNGFHWIALAHNQDDVVETMLINLSRGTGIRGLSGMNFKSGRIIRPLLYASRWMIEKYQQDKRIPFVEDSSNASIKYKRNRIRHKIIPEFEKLNPNFKNSAIETIQNIKKIKDLFLDQISEKTNHLIHKEGDNIQINIHELVDFGHTHTYLYELLIPYGFSHQIIPKITESLNSNSGKQFFSKTHRLVKDRDYLILTSIKKSTGTEYKIESGTKKIEAPVNLRINKIPHSSEFTMPSSDLIATFDFDLLTFPLKLRKWKQGDRFQPLGMKKTKKLSDFFIDQKLSLPEKENIWLLTSEKQIIWVVGYRIDDRFKVSEKSKNLLQVETYQ